MVFYSLDCIYIIARYKKNVNRFFIFFHRCNVKK
nr:MAG TPA: hypothetical protein [Caudoviricetes sp.]